MYFYRNSLQNLYLIKTAITFHLLSRRPFNYACLEIFFLHFYLLVVNVILLIKLRKTIRPLFMIKIFLSPRRSRAYCFCPVCHSFWNFYLANNIWRMSARAMIFHMSISSHNTFLWIQTFWTCGLDLGDGPTFWPCL